MSERNPWREHAAILLSRRKAGEGHRVVRLLLDDDSAVTAFVPAAERSQRRFGSRVRPFDTLSAGIRSRGLDRCTLERADRTLVSRSSLAESPLRMAAASVALELLDKLVPDGEHDQPYFQRLGSSLDWAAKASPEDLEAGWVRPVLDLLEVTGYSEGRICRGCGSDAIWTIDPELRRGWCRDCSLARSEAIAISDTTAVCEAVERFFDGNIHVRTKSIPLLRLALRGQLVDERSAM